jgi:hypothetical protein
MTAQAAGVNSDAAAKPSWDAPVAMIGGLPIAVIDRARSAELMIDVALRRRGTAQRPLSSPRRTVRCSRCAPGNRESASFFSKRI